MELQARGHVYLVDAQLRYDAKADDRPRPFWQTGTRLWTVDSVGLRISLQHSTA